MVTKAPAHTLIPRGVKQQNPQTLVNSQRDTELRTTRNPPTHSTRRPGSFDAETNSELGILQYLQPEPESEKVFFNAFTLY